MTETSFEATALPESVRGFAALEKGLVVVSGEDAAAAKSCARAVAGHIEANGARATLVDRCDADTLVQAVDTAWNGELVVMAAPFGENAYSRLVELLQSAEAWEIRPRFDAVLHAVVQLSEDGGAGLDVYLPSFNKAR